MNLDIKKFTLLQTTWVNWHSEYTKLAVRDKQAPERKKQDKVACWNAFQRSYQFRNCGIAG